MNKKNLLIISHCSINTIGGSNIYNKTLVECLSNKFNFYEAVFSNKMQNDNSAKHDKLFKSYQYKICKNIEFKIPIIKWLFDLLLNNINYFIICTKLKKIIKKNNIDCIIFANDWFLFKKINKKVHTIYVQHVDDKHFTKKINYTKFYRFLWYKMNRCFLGSKINLVTFTQLNKKKLFDENKHKGKIFICPIGRYKRREIHNVQNDRKKIVYIGRISKEKNIEFLINVSKELEKNSLSIDFYGPDDYNILKNYKNFHGPKNENQINEILKQTKLLVLASESEGFPIVVVEALSKGVPVVLYDSFTNAKFLINNERGKIIKNLDVLEFKKAIEDIYYLSDNDYAMLQKNCIKFAEENLTLEKFIKKWEDIIEVIIGK